MAQPSKQEPNKARLTDLKLKSLEPAEAGRRYILWDTQQANFGARVTDAGIMVKGKRRAGHIAFVSVGHKAGGGQAWTTLGRYPGLSLQQARKLASAALDLLAAGRKPLEVEKERRDQEARRRADTFTSVADDFIKRHVKPNLRTAQAVEQTIRNSLIPRWENKPITSISRRDVIEMVEGISDRGSGKRKAKRRRGGRYAARHAFAAASKLFAWALHRDAYGLEANPCASVKISELIGKPSRRTRVLSDAELLFVWRAARRLGYPNGKLVQALMLSGLRLNEWACARWPEIDSANAVFTVPAERMKSKEAHSVPLTPRMVSLLATLPRFPADRKGPSDHLFTTTFGARPISGFSKLRSRLDEEISHWREALARLERRRGSNAQVLMIPPFTIHDIRRTVRSRLSELGVLPLVAELVLGHKQQGIAAVYDLYRYDREKRDALLAWETKLLSIVEQKSAPPAKVADLGKARAARRAKGKG